MRLRISTSWQMPQKAKEKRLFCVCAPHSPLHVNMMVDSSTEERGEREERPGRAILIHRGWKYETRRKEMPSLNQKLMFCFKESAIVWKTMPKVILKTFHTEKKQNACPSQKTSSAGKKRNLSMKLLFILKDWKQYFHKAVSILRG